MPKLKSLLKVKRDDELPLLSIGLPTKKERVKPVKVEKKKRTMEAETVVRKVPKEKKKKDDKLVHICLIGDLGVRKDEDNRRNIKRIWNGRTNI